MTAPATGLPAVAFPPPRQDWRRRVAHAFSRAAPRYHELAAAQLAMGERLWERLPPTAQRVLDLGCGPGDWTARLADRYAGAASLSAPSPAPRPVPQPRIIGLDLAPGMLAQAHRRHGHSASWLCGDAAQLPLATNSLDLVFSNLAIQWCPDQAAVMAELHRVLAPGGEALINTLGPGTLAEVATAWSHPGRPAALLDFATPRTLERAARGAGFRTVRLEAATERFHYPDLAAVMASIKGVGAQTSRDGAALTRRDLARARRRYETLRTAAGLPVSYRRLSLHLIK